ncbi:MAG: tubulin-like doman-containing protein [Azospirillaceae bacterium]|nr:tubulin-like doman-containing protein [Azospirillaceae bacterium]
MNTVRHIVIGLGGLGRAVILGLRNMDDALFVTLESRRADVCYLYVDIAEELFNMGSVGTFDGDDMQDRARAVIRLDFSAVLASSNKLSAEMRSWVGVQQGIYKANQAQNIPNPRRMASMMMAEEGGALIEAIQRQTEFLGVTPEGPPLMIHVVGALNGGVGGGAMARLLVQLRVLLQGQFRYRLVCYGWVPSANNRNAGPAEVIGYANAGATLAEFDALNTGMITMIDPSKDMAIIDVEGPWDEQYLVSPIDETGAVPVLSAAPPPAPATPAARARQAIPLIAAIRQRMDIGTAATPFADRDDAEGRQYLSSVGSKVITTAVDEIEEALALSFLQSALAQLLFNNWHDDRGFACEACSFNAESFVRRPEVEARWLLSSEHLIQSVGLLPEDTADRRWKALSDEWSAVVDAFVDLVQGQDQRQWIDSLTRLCHQRYAEDFRGVGVANFYRARLAVKRELAMEIRRRVERELVNDWSNGNRGLCDIQAIIAALIVFQRERLASIDERIANIRMAEDSCRAHLVASFQEWTRLNSLSRLTGKPKLILHTHAMHLHEMHVNMTRAEGWNFARKLLATVIEELEDLSRDIDRLTAVVKTGLERVDTRLDMLSAELGATEATAHFTVRLYNRKLLQRMAMSLVIDERQQLAHTTEARAEIFSWFPDASGYRTILDWFQRDWWLPALLSVCLHNVRGAIAVFKRSGQPLPFRSSIYDQLIDQFGSDPGQLREFAAAIVRDTAALLPVATDKPMPARLYVLLPQQPDKEAFIRTLKSAFWSVRGVDLRFVDVDEEPNRLSLMKVIGPFAADEVPALVRLTEFYQTELQRDMDDALLSLHGFGTQESLQRWYQMKAHSPDVLGGALVLLGLALGPVVQQPENAARDPGRILLIPRDADGFEGTPLVIAETLLTAPQELTPANLSLLRSIIRQSLATSRSGRDEIVAGLLEQLAVIRTKCGNDATDPTYRKFVDAGKAASDLVRGGK